MNFADNLKKIRKDHNLSQEQLAEKLGVTRQSVSKWESRQSYPEMDKVIQICNMFNYNMDELINADIKEVKETKESKNISNKYITSFFNYLTKVVDMFSSMKLKQIIGCLFEQVIIGLILVSIIAIVGSIGYGVLSSLLRNILPYNLYIIIISILETISIIAFFVLGVAVLLHIFKIRYLDYYEFVGPTDNNEDNNILEENKVEDKIDDKNKVEKKEKIVLEKKQEKVIIRDPKHSDFKFLSGLGNIILWMVKFFIAWVLLFFAMGFVGLVVCLVLSFLFIKTGLLFVGLVLAIIGSLILCGICIELFFNFIFSRKNSKTRFLISGLISLVAIGSGIGLLIVGISEFDIAVKDTNLVKDEYVLEMKDNLMIARYFNYYHNIEYIEENRNDVKVEVEHSKYYVSNMNEEGGLIYIYNYVPDEEVLNMIRLFIKDFNHKKIVDYDSEQMIRVYASKENIDKMKNNRKDYYDNNDRLLDSMNKLQDENERLEVDINRFESLLEDNGYVIIRDTNNRIVEIYRNNLDY